MGPDPGGLALMSAQRALSLALLNQVRTLEAHQTHLIAILLTPINLMSMSTFGLGALWTRCRPVHLGACLGFPGCVGQGPCVLVVAEGTPNLAEVKSLQP